MDHLKGTLGTIIIVLCVGLVYVIHAERKRPTETRPLPYWDDTIGWTCPNDVDGQARWYFVSDPKSKTVSCMTAKEWLAPERELLKDYTPVH